MCMKHIQGRLHVPRHSWCICVQARQHAQCFKHMHAHMCTQDEVNACSLHPPGKKPWTQESSPARDCSHVPPIFSV